MNNTLIKIRQPDTSLIKELLGDGFSINQSTILASRVDAEGSLNETLNPTHQAVPSPLLYKDMDKAAQKLADAIMAGEKVVCAVDFDTDGINSGAIFQRALVDFFNHPEDKTFIQVSHRLLWGYGYTDFAAKNIFREHDEDLPSLIITADQGSSNEASIKLTYEMAKDRNHELDVIVTDHHHIPAQGPDSAYAFVNPQRQPELSQNAKDVCGAMVIFLLMLRTKEVLCERGHLPKQTKINTLLAYASIATISDVMSLKSPCNRFVCHKGFAYINKLDHPAWIFLRSEAKGYIDEDFIGFQISPRVNAGGRVGLSGKTGLEFLCSKDIAQARDRYRELTEANEERKDIGQEMLSDAFDIAQKQVESGQAVIVVYLPNGNSGNSGIVAGRLKEYFHRPALMLAPINETESTGSARSIAGVDIRSCLEYVAENHPGIIVKYGGHPVAAGMTCKTENIELFSKYLNEAIVSKLDPEDMTPVAYVDFVLNELYKPMGVSFIDEVAPIKPFGQKFEPPLVAAQGTVSDCKGVGKKGKVHLQFKLLVNGVQYTCIWFNARSDESQDWPADNGDFLTFVLRPSANTFRNNRTLQFHVITTGEFDTNENRVFL